jgi:hypothetical protein
MKKYLLLLALPFALWNCKTQTDVHKTMISSDIQKNVSDSLIKQFGAAYSERISKGVAQTAALWTAQDGDIPAFIDFCRNNYYGDENKRDTLFLKLSNSFEILWGNFNRITLDLKRPVDEKGPEITPIDEMMAAYDVSAHFTNDMFSNKVAFIVALNFPSYTLAEKEQLGHEWTRKEWAYARLGDIFTSRVPAEISQNITKAFADADMYISQYNIYAGKLLNNNGKALFPDDMVLLSHWNIRDEIKSNYADSLGIEKQRLLYEVMKRIVRQEIPSEVINSNAYTWNPYSNKLYQQNAEISFKAEPNSRFEYLLNNYKAVKQADPYYTQLNTYIARSFEGGMEMRLDNIENLFAQVLQSKEFKATGELISRRLGRNLEPFDIWYDGFKTRSTLSSDMLDAKTRAKYPDNKAFKNDIQNILIKLGWAPERAAFIASKIDVDAARGSGHAWGAQMRNDQAHLRTRIGDKGMDYKGYNIAVHELGHNVEQTISMNNVDFYLMNGVPNTAFTEALAFLFQSRDLQLLDIKNDNPQAENYQSLDRFWGLCEIMGVSMVDIGTWKWMYEHPQASASECKEAVNRIATEVWNKYFAPVFGVKDQPVLAIYSHMIASPLYLSNYAFGQIIEFQLETYMKGKNFATEVDRIYRNGKLTPQEWMKQAVGSEISVEPLLQATQKALQEIK